MQRTTCELGTPCILGRRRRWLPTPVLLPGKSHGWRSLVGCSPWRHYKSDMTERLYFHFSLSCIEKGNGNPLQCSCLENSRDGGAWWADVYGVEQSRTQLKLLSSSSSSTLRLSSSRRVTSFLSILWPPLSSPSLLYLPLGKLASLEPEYLKQVPPSGPLHRPFLLPGRPLFLEISVQMLPTLPAYLNTQ